MSEPTERAMRFAELWYDSCTGHTYLIEEWAEELDKETGLPELLRENSRLEAQLAEAQAEREKLLEECVEITECAYALESFHSLSGNYPADTPHVIKQGNKGADLFDKLFGIGRNRKLAGITRLQEINAAEAAKESE